MLHDLAHTIISYFSHHHLLAVILTFCIAFLEALPILGTIIPGSIVMTAVGTLVGSGVIPGVSTVISATLGAFIGDCLGFAIGVRYQHNYRLIWPFKKYPHWMDASEAFFHRHGGKSVIIGRFIGPARSTVPMVAGLLKLSWPRFIGAAIPSAILWVIAYMLPGILLGAFALEVPIKESSHFILFGLIIIAAAWFVYWVCQRSFFLISLYAHHVVHYAWNWLKDHHSTHWFTTFLYNEEEPNDSSQLMKCLLSITLLFFFCILFLRLNLHHSLAAGLNHPVYHLLQSLRSPWLDHVMIVITAFANTKFIALITFITLVFLTIKRLWRFIFYLIGTMAISTAITYLIKTTYTSLRPDIVLPFLHENSFPSGHTVISIAFFGFTAFITRQCYPQWKNKPYTIATIIIALIMISRLYLGAHWFTDILGGFLLSYGVLLGSLVLYHRKPYTFTKPSPYYWGAMLTSILVIIPSIYIPVEYTKIASIYQPQLIHQQTTSTAWWQQPLTELPIARLSRFGKPIQPFNLQWADQLEHIKSILITNGWQILNNQQEAQKDQLPMRLRPQRLFPPLHLNRSPVLSAVYRDKDHQLIELNLWKSKLSLSDLKTPVWIGTVSLSNPNNHRLITKMNANAEFTIDAMIQQLNLSQIETQRIQVPPNARPQSLNTTHWDGMILIIQPVSPKQD